MTDWRVIQARIKVGEPLFDAWKYKCHALRAAVLGDYSGMGGKASAQVDEGLGEKRTKAKSRLQDLYDILMLDFTDGQTNILMDELRTIMISAAFKQPAIEADGLHPDEEALISEYLRVRMGPKPRGCEAIDPMRLAAMSFLIEGLGATWTAVDGSKPCTYYVDNIDLGWDTGARFLKDARYFYWRYVRTIGEWIDYLDGEEDWIKDVLDQNSGTLALGASGIKRADAMEMTQELVYYCETGGSQPAYALARADRVTERRDDVESVLVGNSEHGPILYEQSPYWVEIDGFKQFYSPINMLRFMQFPSAPLPIGIAEMMLPHQTMHNIYERTEQLMIVRGVTQYFVEDGTFEDEAQEQAFTDGEVGAVVKIKKGANPPHQNQAMDPGPGLINALMRQKKAAVTSGGANPFSSGDTVEGTEYASEVQAIQINAGKVEGAVRIEVTNHWAREARSVLWLGSRFDIGPLTLNMDGDKMEFGLHDPISQYLVLDAELVVSEDGTAYMSREQKIQKALTFAKVAMENQDIAPGSRRIAYEGILQAFGFRNFDKHFSGQAPVAADPAAEAAALQGAAAGGQ